MTDEKQNISATEEEAAKTRQQRAEDVAYTINHALACTATDWMETPISNATQKYLGKRLNVSFHQLEHLTEKLFSKKKPGKTSCSHNHSHSHGHSHGHSHSWKEWLLGEFTGDFGAVPITIGLQRYAPKFMAALNKVLEPMLGWVFRFGAQRSAKRWARKEGIAQNSQACKDRAEELYQYEVRHLPQMAVWTASSSAINIGMQKFLTTDTAQNSLKKIGITGVHGNHGPIWLIALTKAIVATGVAVVVVGSRALFPKKAHQWDSFVGEKVFLPMTKKVGKKIGVEEEAVDRMAKEHERLKHGNEWRNLATAPRAAAPSIMHG